MPNLETTEHFLPLFDEQNEHYKKRNLVWKGGRGGAKSWQIARGLLVRGRARPLTILCTREFQSSMRDSVLAVLSEQAEKIGLRSFYQFQENAVYGRNGTNFSFKGIKNNIDSIKSFEGADLVWNEEAQRTSANSIKKLYPTIRKPGSQIITSFNPESDTDPIYVEHVTNFDPKTDYLCHVNYTDNPWIDDDFIARAEKMRALDYDEYAHIYLGECWTRSEAQVFNGKWIVDEFDIPVGADGPYNGLDFGFAQDPTFAVQVWIYKKVLYIAYERSKNQLEIEDTPEWLKSIPNEAGALWRADCSRPETISHIKNKGVPIVGAEKWAGSVEDGVTVIRSFDKIVIHARCTNMIQEARLYSHKVDKLTGDILKTIVDKHNHGWDAVRYALAPMIKRKPKGFFDVSSSAN